VGDLIAPPAVVPFWLAGKGGDIFCVRFEPANGARSKRGLLVIPPFAEEMNKSRRMLASLARAVAQRGYPTLLLDLFGTGDSAGDLDAADVPLWLGNLASGAEHLAAQGVSTLDVVAVRSGCLLMDRSLTGVGLRPGRLVLWQPVVSGKQFMNHFLRLRLAGDLIGQESTVTMVELRAELRQSGSLEVAGYRVSQSLVQGLESRDLVQTIPLEWDSVSWMDIGAENRGNLSPGSSRAADLLATQGRAVTRRTIAGQPFWATPEIAMVPELIEASVAYLGLEVAA